MPRFIALLCLTLAACRPAADPAPVVDAVDTDVFFERASELDEQLALHPPTMAAAEGHALALAQLSRQASDAPRGTRYPYGARRLAAGADLVRNELLACRGPLWELRWPPQAATVITYHPWLVDHRNELRHGMADGWTTSRLAVDLMQARIDRTLRPSGDRTSDLYIDPPLREHGEFLVEELRPNARAETGLVHLPTGPQCFDARAQLLIGPQFDARSSAAAAKRLLESPRMLADIALLAHPAIMGASQPGPHWRSNQAVMRGVHLLHHTQSDRRGAAIVAAVAAGALVDLALHRDGDRSVVTRLRDDTPWIATETFDGLVERSAIEPLFWLSMFEGYRTVKVLQGSMPADQFHERVLQIGALEPELLARELRKPH